MFDPRLCCPVLQHLPTLPHCPILFSSLSYYPPRPALAPVLPIAMFWSPSFPLTSPLPIHPRCFLPAPPPLPIVSPFITPSNLSLPFPALVMPSDFTYSCSYFHCTLSPSPCIAPWSPPHPMFHPPFPVFPFLSLSPYLSFCLRPSIPDDLRSSCHALHSA